MPEPELQARQEIDDQLKLAGWHVCDFGAHDISRPCAISEFPLKSGHGKAAGVIETKKVGHTPKGVDVQSTKYTAGLSDELVAWDKASLDIFWLKDESLEDSENLPEPRMIAAKIVEDQESALEEMRLIAEDLGTETT